MMPHLHAAAFPLLFHTASHSLVYKSRAISLLFLEPARVGSLMEKEGVHGEGEVEGEVDAVHGEVDGDVEITQGQVQELEDEFQRVHKNIQDLFHEVDREIKRKLSKNLYDLLLVILDDLAQEKKNLNSLMRTD